MKIKIILFYLLMATQLVFSQTPKKFDEVEHSANSGIKKGLKSTVNDIFTIHIEYGHLGEVLIGCSEHATDGFDPLFDDMAPPPGMGGIGYTFLISPDRKYNLYKDIRGYSNEIQWVLYVKPGSNPVTLSWLPNEIPPHWELFCAPWDGKSETLGAAIDCRKNSRITANKTTFFRLWIICRN